ncbi:hypothetical protein CR205_03260 [Alteribacter lacisalsi]|jgi:hypothetical protein|uniref:Uncharacterized protein n=1 Tax=Alteribacter lacisalsi TaxID=2045244 RepID=A0A2W0HVC7_9BACI|nr:hypothetical protein [Alteribacter lacisalsi]PYZ97628.1 hypothetical protein CR205_03260 [Alteribacter lacisalsi]
MFVKINAIEEEGVFFHVSDPVTRSLAGFARKVQSNPGAYQLSVIGQGAFTPDQVKLINEEIDRMFSRSLQ